MVSRHSQWPQAHLLVLEGAPNTVERPLGSCWNDAGELLGSEALEMLLKSLLPI